MGRFVRHLLSPLLVAACSDVLGPDRGNPAQYAFAEPAGYGCRGYYGPTPASGLGLFDIPGWVRTDSETPKQAKARLIESVLAAGGTIVHRFNVLVVRAILPIESVREVGSAGAWGVVRPRNYDLPVYVTFRGAIVPGLVEAHGGTVLLVYDTFAKVFAMMPDGKIPSLLRDFRITSVSHGLILNCP